MMVLKFVIKNEYLKKFKLTDYKYYAMVETSFGI